MGTPVLTATTVPMCAHAGTGMPIPGNARVLLSGAPILCVGDPVLVNHCLLDPTQGPPPCTSIRTHGSARVTASGRAVAIASGAVSQPNGSPAFIAVSQERVLVG